MATAQSNRKIPSSGINLFQLIYILIDEYAKRTGEQPINLSLGNPDTVPADFLLQLAGDTVKNPNYAYHTYAESNDLDAFSAGMVELHGKICVAEYPHLKALPIAGIKTATAMLPLACGLHNSRNNFLTASNFPAYDIIGTWGEGYLGAKRLVWPLTSADNMRLNIARLKTAIAENGGLYPNLIFVIRPGNPAAVGCNEQEWIELIEFCILHNIRLANDAAYAGLAGENHISLASVAKNYPNLEWVELYSVSKSFSDPGARLGAIVGSVDFIDDFVMIKGNTDSGPVPGLIGAYGKLFADKSLAQKLLDEKRELYDKRLQYLIPTLKNAGLRPACETAAGFFTLWHVPKYVFGIDLESYAQEHNYSKQEAFNRLVISRTGIVGVHFGGAMVNGKSEAFIRYAVCTDTDDLVLRSRLEKGLGEMQVKY